MVQYNKDAKAYNSAAASIKKAMEAEDFVPLTTELPKLPLKPEAPFKLMKYDGHYFNSADDCSNLSPKNGYGMKESGHIKVK